MFDRLDDTIVAISSPAGVSLRGLVRLSGPDAFDFASHVFVSETGASIDRIGGYHRLLGRVHFSDGGSVPAELYAFRAPASYTRQDVVELHLIGSPPVLAMLLEALTDRGARQAEPGEFTARAFFSGALDLTRAEGVAAVIHARSDAQLRASEALLHGELSRRTVALRDDLADLLSLLEAEIDFVEEPIDFVSRDQLVRRMDDVSDEIVILLRDSPSAERLDVCPQVMLIGPPNAGKSTLFNALTDMDRAIASATAGTTRDVLSAPVKLPGGEAILLDSAGLAMAETDQEAVAMRAEAATQRSLASADLTLLVVDIEQRPEEATQELCQQAADRPTLIVANKIDLIDAEQRAERVRQLRAEKDVLPASAATGEGLTTLRDVMSTRLFAHVESHGSELLVLFNRQRAALSGAADALKRARRLCDDMTTTCEHTELVAIELREAIDALSLLVGEVTTEDLLSKVFASFCIGK